ncbi:MAG: hypothetical protein NTV92_08050, partial [Candidatus Bipolaricaulota bacterium]|nr:hypothetical protein [Candidatus Bipolaricaulota bacterium]
PLKARAAPANEAGREAFVGSVDELGPQRVLPRTNRGEGGRRPQDLACGNIKSQYSVLFHPV